MALNKEFDKIVRSQSLEKKNTKMENRWTIGFMNI